MHGVGATALGILDPATGELVDAAGPWTEWAPTLAVHGTRVVGVAASPRTAPRGRRAGHLHRPGPRRSAPRTTTPSTPRTTRSRRSAPSPGPGGREIHAHIYPPHNPDHAAPDDELPPYVVWAHGGPTGHAPLVLDLEIAYFTSRGIGVAEVNYGGSTGYGRAYRNRLREQWGVVDVEDCAAVALALADEGTADRDRLAIRGGSAGGWTTAASLTGTDVYACGTIIYPILDLTGWGSGETHDFESQYLESLVGPLAEVPDAVPRALAGRARRPAHRAVPAAPGPRRRDLPARAVRAVPRRGSPAGGVPHAYIAFEGEGHGFRRADTMIRVLEAELSLYAQVFGLHPHRRPACWS